MAGCEQLAKNRPSGEISVKTKKGQANKKKASAQTGA